MPTFWTDRNVICTGGSGFLGSYLVPRLEAAGASVFVPRSADFDLRQDCQVRAMFEAAGGVGAVSVLFHLAATVGGIGANQARPADFYYDNTLMNALVAEHARRFEVGKLVAVGSVCGFPKWSPAPFLEDNFWEGYPEETNAPYGISKRGLLAHLYALRRQYGFNGIYLIPTNLYGPGDSFDPDTSHVIPALVRKLVQAQAENLPHVEVWGTGHATRDFLYVDDCARGLLLAAELYNKPDPVNLGSGEETPIHGLVEMLRQSVGYTGKVAYDQSKPDGQPRRVLNAWKAWHLFGWKATTKLEDGLKKTVEWWRKENEVNRQRLGTIT